MTSALNDITSILASLGQTAFVWDLASDAISWSDHVGAVFPEIPAGSLASGAELAKLIEPQGSRAVRDSTVHGSPPPQLSHSCPEFCVGRAAKELNRQKRSIIGFRQARTVWQNLSNIPNHPLVPVLRVR